MRLSGSIAMVCCACGLPALAAEGPPFQVQLDPATAAIRAVTVAGHQTKLPAESGGFSVFDATAKKPIALAHGSVQRAGEKTTFSCDSPEIRLTADFVEQGPYVLVSGTVENLQPGERGVVLDYAIPCPGPQAAFSNELNVSQPVGEAEEEGNVYPIASLSAGELGLAMAIPPSAPCVFGMAGSRRGLVTRFYLGLSPETKRFPNRAAFTLIVYPVEPAWGFRSALSRYYDFYPRCYTNRLGRDGWHLFLAEDGKEPDPPDMSYIAYDTVETQAPWLQARLERNVKHGIPSLPYMIVGQREIKFLPGLPSSYDEALAAYARWSPEYNQGHPPAKEIESAGNDRQLRLEVDGCNCQAADGHQALTIRHTLWGLDSVTFTMNPNPDLYRDTHDQSVGRSAIRRVVEWNKTYPAITGATIDSLGAFFPAMLNYRHEHFAYARYPLTCDPDGRVALHNTTSHYEFLETLQQELAALGGKERFVGANGIYSYRARPDPPEHYRSGRRNDRTRLGRFFLAAQLDFATSEPGIGAEPSSVEFMRVAMGRKIYSPSNARWTERPKVEQWLNRCLCYSLFGFNVRRYADPIQYYLPDGYQRDKELIDWFMPNVRLLYRAGWQPVTSGRVNLDKVLVERYGQGQAVYFALMSEAQREDSCTLTVNLKSLGIPADGSGWTVEEVARATPLTRPAPEKIQLVLKPYETVIVALRKAG